MKQKNEMIEELREAIDYALKHSRPIRQIFNEINRAGYDTFLHIQPTIGIAKLENTEGEIAYDPIEAP